ncbi:MACF1 [Bugula neritina]|uniref:MACF1 n=1 Tax=Bugula neritina TaxID=10212 RepID=A0A7J7K097_BUGNE|nr:MACF1 [Bugula neritina]
MLHSRVQRALGSKQPTYDLVMKQGKEQLVKSTLENDTQTIGDMLTSLKSKWTSVCGKSVDRQRKLEESLLVSGQFKDALQALLGWLYKIEPFISDEQNVHGDLDTVTKLADQQKVFQSELSKRASNMAQVRDTAKELIEKSEDNMPELQSQLIDLTTSWDKVTKQAERRQARIQEAFRLAEEFSQRASTFLEWVSDCEHQLKLNPDRADDETALQAALDEHRVFIEEVGKQRLSLSETLRLGDDILSKAHQEAVPIMKKWLIILRQHMDNVDTWSANFEKSIQDSLDAISNSSNLIEELLGWLASSEGHLLAMEEIRCLQKAQSLKKCSNNIRSLKMK